jgi:hypothetical protein
MSMGIDPPVLITDNHAMHIQEHKQLLDSPESRGNIDLVAIVLGHIQEHINQLKKETPTPTNLSKIESELRGLSTTVNQKVIPAIERQEQNFGKVILIETNLQAYERKLYTMYEAVIQLLKERKDRK